MFLMIVYLVFEIKIYTILLYSLKEDNIHIRIQERIEIDIKES